MRIVSRSFVLGAVVVGLGAAVGCGSDGQSVGTGGGSSTTTSTSSGEMSTSSGAAALQACQDQVHAICTRRDACSRDGFLNDRIWGSEAICEKRTLPACLELLQAPASAETPAHIESCVAVYSTYACTDFFDDSNPPAACLPAVGTLPTGAACGGNAQCATAYCARSVHQVCGTCQPRPKVGAPCQGQGDCGGDLACVIPVGTTTGTCTDFVPSGGACLTPTLPCQSGFACVGDDPMTSTMGTCKAQASTVGAACDGSRQTMPNCNVNLGLACIPSGASTSVGTCATISLVQAGQPCGPIGTPVTAVADCAAGGLCVNNVCVPPAAEEGAACDSDPNKGPPCLAPAKCVLSGAGTAGTCRYPDATKCH